jgi:hypothetical protein
MAVFLKHPIRNLVFKKSWGNTQGFGFGLSFDPNKDDEDALDPLPIPTEVSSQQKSNSPQNLATQMNTSESARDRPKGFIKIFDKK